MRGFFNGLILGLILGAVGFWFVQKKAREHPEAQQRYEASASRAGAAMSVAATNISDALRAKLETLGLTTDKIKDELARTGEVVRRKAQDIGGQAVNAASDARAVTEIKAKLAADPALADANISVTCAQGHVTLSGTVASPQKLGEVIERALEVGGVRDVVSKVQVKPSDNGSSKSGARPSPAAAARIVPGHWNFSAISLARQVAVPEAGRAPASI